MSADKNRQFYGKCNNPYGHGHDYWLEVTVEGPLNRAGHIADRSALDEIVQSQVVRRLNHRNLNADVSELSGGVPPRRILRRQSGGCSTPAGPFQPV